MSKKTRAQKEKAALHRIKQLDNIVKLSYNKETPGGAEFSSIISDRNKLPNLADSQESDKENYLYSDIKKCLIVVAVFFFIIIALYFLENKYQFIAIFGEKLITFVLK